MNMTFVKKFLLILLFALPLTACDNDGPAENMGESVDEAVDDTGDAMEDAGDSAEDTFD